METCRWAVVAASCLKGHAQTVISMMSGLDGIEVAASSDADDRLKGLVGIVLVIDPHDLQSAAEQVTRLHQRHPSCALLCAAERHAAVDMAALLKAGSHDFILLPCSAAELDVRLRRATGHLGPGAAPGAVAPRPDAIRGFVYVSRSCEMVAAKLPVIAACQANVLITGETGTGKEVCARAVHYMSARASRPWVALNCGALPTELVENELFGHAKGAYTTAHAASPGLVRQAEGGTLFLDEVDSLPLPAQAKLLRFLQEHEYRPVGSSSVVHADVRVIAASNTDLYALMQGAHFRQDLFFRLNVLNVNIPALRERREDIPVLALHFLREFAREFDRGVGTLSSAALHKLSMHDWPGNVRELRHVIERAVLLSKGPTLGPEDIDIGRAGSETQAAEDESFRAAKTRAVESFERGYVEQLLTVHGGNVTHAAQAAKKDRRAFFELIRKHGIQPQRFRLPAA
ncbi:sigma-54 dependent transcriptional regulator [Roseateles sp. P5_D6]